VHRSAGCFTSLSAPNTPQRDPFFPSDLSGSASTVGAVRLIVARCEVTYSGRLNAFLPESTRLLMIKADGSVLVHADAGGYKPLN
jgi:RecB family endonuclease NucS